jgi:hypothetical protein
MRLYLVLLGIVPNPFERAGFAYCVTGTIKTSWRENKMKATRILLAAMVLGTVVGASQANAQCSGIAGTCNTTNTASVTVGALVKLGMSGTTTALTAPTADDIDVGALIDNVGPTFTIKANRSWTLKIRSQNAASWTYVSGGNSGVKPISHLAWATVNGGTYNAITGSDVTFASGAAASNGTAAAAFFRTTWLADFADPSNREGVYSLPIVFTLTAP